MHNESRAELMVNCDTVTVEVTNAQGNPAAQLTVPAFTVTQAHLGVRVAEELEEYLNRARVAYPVSLGDFALYLLARASEDPKRQPRA